MDNRDGGYGFGEAEEDFTNVRGGPNYPNAYPNTDEQDNPVNNSVFPMLGAGLFIDYNQALTRYPADYPYEITLPDELLLTFDQKWWLRESGDRRHIDTHSLVVNRYDISRTGG